MKITVTKWGIIAGLLITAVVMLAGCNKPYLPADFASDLDTRIIQLEVDIADPANAACAEYLQSDLTFLRKVSEASK